MGMKFWERTKYGILEKEAHDYVHRKYYDGRAWWEKTQWLGVEILKNPFDLWIYQEILHKNRPDIIIETGSFNGGSALYLSNILDLIDHGRVISIDIETHNRTVSHPRLEFWQASSVAAETLNRLKDLIQPSDKVMVILDSDHSETHVYQELQLYSPLVSSGQYLIVEDTNVNGYPVFKEHGPGPMEATQRFLKETSDFHLCKECEKFPITFNPSGYLIKK
jgi:cephalosporin hydroxylase